MLSTRLLFTFTVILCPYVCVQVGSHFCKWDHSHPMEEQQKEQVADRAAEGVPGRLVPRGSLGQRGGPRRSPWNTCRGELSSASSSFLLLTAFSHLHSHLGDWHSVGMEKVHTNGFFYIMVMIKWDKNYGTYCFAEARKKSMTPRSVL